MLLVDFIMPLQKVKKSSFYIKILDRNQKLLLKCLINDIPLKYLFSFIDYWSFNCNFDLIVRLRDNSLLNLLNKEI